MFFCKKYTYLYCRSDIRQVRHPLGQISGRTPEKLFSFFLGRSDIQEVRYPGGQIFDMSNIRPTIYPACTGYTEAGYPVHPQCRPLMQGDRSVHCPLVTFAKKVFEVHRQNKIQTLSGANSVHYLYIPNVEINLINLSIKYHHQNNKTFRFAKGNQCIRSVFS